MAVILFSGSLPGLLPTAIAGCKVWYDPMQEAYADNAAVSTMTDRSGNAYNATQGVGANQPTFKTNIKNGQSIYRFDGGDYTVAATITNIFSAAAGTAIIVAKLGTANTNQATSYDNEALFSETNGGRVGIHFKTTPVQIGVHYDGSVDDASIGGASVDGVWHIWTYMYDSSNVYIGKTDTRTASMGVTASGATVGLADNMNVGVNYNAVAFFDGDVGDFAVWNVALTEGNRKLIEQRYAYKYGITLPY
jgi:hypothetical protein